MARGHYDRTRLPRRGRPGFLRAILGDLDREWMNRALCRLIPLSEVDEMFFPINGRSHQAKRVYEQRVTRAKAICNRCPVEAKCREYRATIQDENGVWGGLDEIDRDETRPRPTAQPKPKLRSSHEGSTRA
ncbi:WhiB family transcriptional regulator [Mycobacterium hackensackense]|uniref:WhiB family transcriptional regulator n=1 Tax=Mycobacterium hackensackense TaxID=228909 RepID=UPI002265B270|nr:WhiB family transcriptional regulator [Mycobacterium hackensackense]MCV7255660.1 WhiB family transcriptional regulator [Mycobacterium hackensackense]